MKQGAFDFTDIARDLQEAAIDPSCWSSLLSSLSRNSGGAGALLFPASTRIKDPTCSDDLSESAKSYARSGWHQHDRRCDGLPILERRGIFTDQDYISTDQMKKDAFYQDFLSVHGLHWFCGIGFRAGEDLWLVSLQRSAAQGAFQAAEINKLKSLWRPLADAATLSRLLDRVRIPAFTSALQYVSHAALVCDRLGQVLQINESADQLIGRQIDPKTRTLSFRDARSRARFDGLLSEALNPQKLFSTEALATDVLDLAGRSITARAINLQGDGQSLFSGGKLLILLQLQVLALESILARDFGLTKSEIEIASSLATGSSVAEIAVRRRTKADSIRTQLKRIYLKTGLTGQVKLVALCNRLKDNLGEQ